MVARDCDVRCTEPSETEAEGIVSPRDRVSGRAVVMFLAWGGVGRWFGGERGRGREGEVMEG